MGSPTGTALLRCLAIALVLSVATSGNVGDHGSGGSEKQSNNKRITRGVDPAQRAQYLAGETFKCDGGLKNLPIARVNDEYCDCTDGTDEPGARTFTKRRARIPIAAPGLPSFASFLQGPSFPTTYRDSKQRHHSSS